MEQEKVFENSDKTFNEYLEEKKRALVEKQDAIEEQFNDPSVYDDTILYEKLLADYSVIQNRCEKNIDNEKIKEILTAIRFNMQDYDKKISTLSGGQKTKLRIAEALSRDADFFILDEPTNHLDFATIKWLEERIKNTEKTFLVVSHDRFFINTISTKIVEIEASEFQAYTCSYNLYLQRKSQRHEALKNKHISVTREKNRLRKSEEEKRAWAHLVGSKKMKAVADNLKRRAENLGDTVDPATFIENFKLQFLNGPETATNIFKVDNLSKSFIDEKNQEVKILEDVSFTVEKGEKIAILGRNGAGKTTLLKIFAGLDRYFQGDIKTSNNLKIGYLDQEFKDMNKKQKVMEFLWEADQKLMEHDIIGTLIKFGFPMTKINDKLEKLSGGEKTRVSLVKLMLSKCNVLLLDEPTNNLDVELIESLEKAINEYHGTTIFVSHDRRFINQVAQRILLIKDYKIDDMEGTYKDHF